VVDSNILFFPSLSTAHVEAELGGGVGSRRPSKRREKGIEAH
jgi:hypothetical protein